MIALLDYGMGNLKSVSNALHYLGAKHVITSSPEEVEQASHIILPGVGAFGDAMSELHTRALIQPIKKAIAAKKPFFGICLGLQLLFEGSEENPGIAGIGIFKGVIKKFVPSFHGERLKIPHMGWNSVTIQKPECPLVHDVADGRFFYFVHSYYADTQAEKISLGTTTYGVTFSSLLWRDNVFAAQFHPEKSQNKGVKILENFTKL
jgi:imidazole glycerol-phosphate synthase subunit HisH